MSTPKQEQPVQQPQLRMKRTLDLLPELVVPADYSLRHFTPDDGEAWARLLDTNGELGKWDATIAVPYFAADSQMPLEGAFFVTSGLEPVATAGLHLKSDGIPELGWVAVVPGHQGHGLAAIVSLAVMRFAAQQGHEQISLLTDDYRLAAIWTYLKLGFSPWITDPTHPARWETIQALLDHRHRKATP